MRSASLNLLQPGLVPFGATEARIFSASFGPALSHSRLYTDFMPEKRSNESKNLYQS
jgi:hypothetical protein